MEVKPDTLFFSETTHPFPGIVKHKKRLPCIISDTNCTYRTVNNLHGKADLSQLFDQF